MPLSYAGARAPSGPRVGEGASAEGDSHEQGNAAAAHEIVRVHGGHGARHRRRARSRRPARRSRRRRQEGRPAHRHRPAARLVRLRRADRQLQGQVRPRRQRTEPRRRFGRRGRGDQGQQGQQGPAGPRRDRRRPVVRPLGQGRRPAAALQGLDLGHDPRLGQGRRRLLDRRLLRRADLRGERRHRQERADRLVRPAEAGIQGRRRARRRPAHLQPGDDAPSTPPASAPARPTPPRRPPRASSSSPTSTRRAISSPSSARPPRSPRARRRSSSTGTTTRSPRATG